MAPTPESGVAGVAGQGSRAAVGSTCNMAGCCIRCCTGVAAHSCCDPQREDSLETELATPSGVEVLQAGVAVKTSMDAGFGIVATPATRTRQDSRWPPLTWLDQLLQEPVNGCVNLDGWDSMLDRLCAGLLVEDAQTLREERAAILEHLAGFPRSEAESRAGVGDRAPPSGESASVEPNLSR